MSKSTNLPSHRLYAVTKDKKQSYWRAIGAIWPHADGEGFNLTLDYLPLNGADLVIRKPRPEGTEDASENAAPVAAG